MSGGLARQQAAPGTYSALISSLSSALDNGQMARLEGDAAQVRPHRLLASAKGQDALFNVLGAAAAHFGGSYPR